jgi:hypothetical protein
MADKTVDGYLAGLESWQAEIVSQVRGIILQAAPQARESIKWAQPVYESGGPFAYMKAFKKAVNFGFWRGIDLDDPKGILEGSGDKMRHVKLTSLEDIDAAQFADFVRQAVELNQVKGDPTKSG